MFNKHTKIAGIVVIIAIGVIAHGLHLWDFTKALFGLPVWVPYVIIFFIVLWILSDNGIRYERTTPPYKKKRW